MAQFKYAQYICIDFNDFIVNMFNIPILFLSLSFNIPLFHSIISLLVDTSWCILMSNCSYFHEM